MEKKVRLGVVGLGKTRGYSMFYVFSNVKNVEIVGICDLYQERLDYTLKYAEENNLVKPYATKDYKDLFKNVSLDAVYIATSWDYHVDIAVEAMEKGISVGMEVGGAYCERDCWKLVETYERTGTPFMFLENCCFNKSELIAYNMVNDGLLGKIAHCSGSYSHDLREEVFTGKEKNHYRIHDYMLRNCENYPTHELGPIAKMLNINSGNRMLSLVSMANEPIGMDEYVLKKSPEQFGKLKFKQSDVVNTLIKCAGGETIELKLETTLPRFYDRNLMIEGTKGLFSQSLYAVYLDNDEKECYETFDCIKKILGNVKEYEDKYLPDYWKNITQEQMDAGHGGMDVLMAQEFIKCVAENKEFPIDVYDAVSWMCISYLSEQSIMCGGAPQTIPDFTRGKWMKRKPKQII